MQLKKGNKVRLRSFNGFETSPDDCEPEENYWKLISETGRIVKDPKESGMYASFSSEKRVCVVFDRNLSKFGLINHNTVQNSLWILESDLEKV
ncbi:MAG: hypothetical protein ACYC5A_04150 [Thermoleophilia bacterium]